MTDIDLKRLRELLANAPKYPETIEDEDGYYPCPMCDGEGTVTAVSAPGTLMVGGYQCYGIGDDPINLEALARAAVRALPELLDRLALAEAVAGAADAIDRCGWRWDKTAAAWVRLENNLKEALAAWREKTK